MSDVTEFRNYAAQSANKACRVAYTLNNDQPVLCTIIDEHPLFYMDHEECEEEQEIFLFGEEIDMIEAEIQNLQREIDHFENFGESDKTTETTFQEFLDNEQDICETNKSYESLNVQDLKDILSKSRVAQAYLDVADDHNVDFCISSDVDGAEYNRKDGIICIGADLAPVDQVLLSAQELRRHWQHRQGALINPLMFHPDNAILVNRAHQADLAASMVRIAWELQLSDYKSAWERLENSSMSDLARSFAREAFADFRTINNGLACAAVFESWFLSERCGGEDRKLIQNMLSDYQGYVFGLDECQGSITPALIAALGTMPFGKNYLAEHVQTIMEDPIFTDVRDRSNANFLWFVKFEKSFRETEQELQSLESNQKAEAFSQAALLKDNRDRHENTQFGQIHGSGAEIIQLYSDFDEAPRKPGTGDGTSAEIIYLRS